MFDPIAHGSEFIYTILDFERVCRLLYQWAGIKLSESKQDMVYSRLARHLRTRGLKSFCEYLDYIERASAEERQGFINALTTNLTYFFRENHHFERLKELVSTLLKERGRLSIWCAAASTGEEPYSIAITVCECCQTLRPPLEVIASDLDTSVLKVGQDGLYSIDRISKLGESRQKLFFQSETVGHENLVRVRQELRSLIRFKQINLLDADWSALHNQKFDAIFCRNVMIYFDRNSQEKLVHRFRSYLQPDGLLFVGHSESLHYAKDSFKSVGNTVYKPI